MVALLTVFVDIGTKLEKIKLVTFILSANDIVFTEMTGVTKWNKPIPFSVFAKEVFHLTLSTGLEKAPFYFLTYLLQFFLF
jgi:hypothetical protein